MVLAGEGSTFESYLASCAHNDPSDNLLLTLSRLKLLKLPSR